MVAMYPPFSKSCDGYRKMVEMLASGEIDPADSSKVAWGKHHLFQGHKLESFRAALNKYKTVHGMMIRLPSQEPLSAAAALAAGECYYM
jgi:hypothetical protein